MNKNCYSLTLPSSILQVALQRLAGTHFFLSREESQRGAVGAKCLAAEYSTISGEAQIQIFAPESITLTIEPQRFLHHIA